MTACLLTRIVNCQQKELFNFIFPQYKFLRATYWVLVKLSTNKSRFHPETIHLGSGSRASSRPIREALNCLLRVVYPAQLMILKSPPNRPQNNSCLRNTAVADNCEPILSYVDDFLNKCELFSFEEIVTLIESCVFLILMVSTVLSYCFQKNNPVLANEGIENSVSVNNLVFIFEKINKKYFWATKNINGTMNEWNHSAHLNIRVYNRIHSSFWTKFFIQLFLNIKFFGIYIRWLVLFCYIFSFSTIYVNIIN